MNEMINSMIFVWIWMIRYDYSGYGQSSGKVIEIVFLLDHKLQINLVF